MATLVTAEQIARLRRMTAEPTSTTYDDSLLASYIERYPRIDEWGESPLDKYGDINPNWTPTYDLNAAAGDIWEEKASAISHKYDFSADGGNFSASQQYEQYMKQARNFRSRRLPSTIVMVKSPPESQIENWVGNLPER